MGKKADHIADLEADIVEYRTAYAALVEQCTKLRAENRHPKANVRPSLRDQVTAPLRDWLDDITKAVGL